MKITKPVRDAIKHCINADIERIEVVNDELRIIVNMRHANIADARSLMTLLETLKSIGFISDKTMTIWTGLRDGKFTLFVSI